VVRIVADAYSLNCCSFRPIRRMRVASRCLRIRVSHQIGNRRFAATCFGESGPKRNKRLIEITGSPQPLNTVIPSMAANQVFANATERRGDGGKLCRSSMERP
jgi:hypothetical protein